MVTLLRVLVLLLCLGDTAGQCTMCQESFTGDWTYWDADCKTKIGDRCLSDLGDWTLWETCCNGGGPPSRMRADSHGNSLVTLQIPGLEWVTQKIHERSGAPPIDPNSIIGLSSVPMKWTCDCQQVQETGDCSLNVTSECSKRCCMESSCECGEAHFSCGIPDGSHCWDHCCMTHMQATLGWHWALQKLSIWVFFCSPAYWALVVVLLVILLNIRRVTREIRNIASQGVCRANVKNPREEAAMLCGS